MSPSPPATPAPFSFHCIICFEGFNLDTRPPVILPCGHTYVCSPCSKRLDRCMECRTSLYLKPQASGQWSNSAASVEPLQNAASDLPSWYRPPPGHGHGGRQQYGHQTGGHHSNKPKARPVSASVEPIALPLPKNLVMMALMETAERERRARKVRRDDRRRARRAEADRAVKAAASAEEARRAAVEAEAWAEGRGRHGAAAAQCQHYRDDGGGDHHRPPIDTVTITDVPGGEEQMECIEKTDESFRKESEDLLALERQEDEDEDEEDDLLHHRGGDHHRRRGGADSDSSSSDGSDSDDESSSKAYESGDDDSAVRCGMDAAFSSYGTYAVRDRVGLTVLTTHPFDGDWEGVGGGGARGGGGTGEGKFVEPSLELEFGRTVQIVEIDGNGVATLARGRGYIVASDEQLVKVGAPLDKACKIEGMIRSVATKKSHYEKKVNDLARLQDGLMAELEDAVQSNPDGDAQHPVIGPVPVPLTPHPPGPEVAFDHEDDAKENQRAEDRRSSGGGGGGGGGGAGQGGRASPRTESSPTNENVAATGSTSPDHRARTEHHHQTPRTPVHAGTAHPNSSPSMANYSPYTIDNSEIGPFCISSDDDDQHHHPQDARDAAQNLRIPKPLVRADSNRIADQFSLGCGFLAGTSSYLYPQGGNDDDSLVGLSFDSAIERQVDRSIHSGNSANAGGTPDRRDNRPSGDRTGSSHDATSSSPSSSRHNDGNNMSSSRSLQLPPEYPRTPDRSYAGTLSAGAASFDTVDSKIDFRSGLSGHRGLLGAKSHADRLKAEQNRRGVRMMGEHRGIASMTSMRKVVRKSGGKKKEENLIDSFRNMSRFMSGNAAAPAAEAVPEWNR